MNRRLPRDYFIPEYLRFLGIINKICCIAIALFILFVGFKMVYGSFEELSENGSFVDYLFFWEYGASLLFFLPIAGIIGYYGGNFNKAFEFHLKYDSTDFSMILGTALIITFGLFIYSIWNNIIIACIFLGIPLLYFILIYHYLRTTETT